MIVIGVLVSTTTPSAADEMQYRVGAALAVKFAKSLGCNDIELIESHVAG